MNILPTTEKQSGPDQLGGWREMARRRYQKGSIRKRGKRDPVWELQWWVDCINSDGTFGRKRESSILGLVSEMTLRQARKAADEILRPLNLGKVSPFSRITLSEFAERHFIPNVFPTLKPSTRNNYRNAFDKHVLPAFGRQQLCNINTLAIQQLVLKMIESGLGWYSADRVRNLLSKVFATAKKWGYFEGDNPASGIELPEKQPVREKRALTAQQISALLRVLPEPVRTMALLAIFTGLRPGELLALRHRDVNLETREIRVEQNWYRGTMGSPKTKGSRRTLHLPDAFVDAYKRLRAPAQDSEELLFKTRTGHPYSDTNLLHRSLKPAGVKISAPWLSWYTFRRTHATLLQAAGGSLKDAQTQLGHSKLSTTLETYTIPLPEHQREAVENLARMVTNGDELPKSADQLPVLTTQIQ